MSHGLWLFLKPNTMGAIERISYRAWSSFFSHKGSIDERFIRDSEWVFGVEVVVDLENRRPVGYREPISMKLKVTEDGLLDREHMFDGMRDTMDKMFSSFGDSDMKDRFVERRLNAIHRWKLRQIDFDAIASAVARRADGGAGKRP